MEVLPHRLGLLNPGQLVYVWCQRGKELAPERPFLGLPVPRSNLSLSSNSISRGDERWELIPVRLPGDISSPRGSGFLTHEVAMYKVYTSKADAESGCLAAFTAWADARRSEIDEAFRKFMSPGA